MFKIGQTRNSIINMLVRNAERLYIPKEKGSEKSWNRLPLGGSNEEWKEIGLLFILFGTVKIREKRETMYYFGLIFFLTGISDFIKTSKNRSFSSQNKQTGNAEQLETKSHLSV